MATSSTCAPIEGCDALLGVSLAVGACTNTDTGLRDPVVRADDSPLDASAPSAPAYQPPALTPPAVDSDEPYYLSQTGLYSDLALQQLAPDLHPFEPRFALWSDGADKRRWLRLLRLPRGAVIDVSEPDHFQLPVGSVLFKEFSRAGKRLETRVIARLGSGPDDYFMAAFVWLHDQSDAVLAREGADDVLGTRHDVPAMKACGTCHNGEPGRVLGLSAVQLQSFPSALFSAPLPELTIPGEPDTVQALGYLHANCSHCHNPSGSARPDTDMNLQLTYGLTTLAQSNAYRTTLDVALQYFDDAPLRLRVAPGSPEQSGLLLRMQLRGRRVQMPPLASEQVDTHGVELVRRWIAGLAPTRPIEN